MIRAAWNHWPDGLLSNQSVSQRRFTPEPFGSGQTGHGPGLRHLAGMIELRQLLYVLAAADQRSFARAATQFRMKQSTLSRKVTRLEDQLGFRLFDRTTRGARPTENARAFLEDARQLVDQAVQLEQSARSLCNANGPRLALGYSGKLFSSHMGPHLYAFLRAYPGVRFDGVERNPEGLLDALTRRKVDAVIVPEGWGGSSLASMPVWKEPLRACFGAEHRLAGLPVLRWGDLASEHLVVPATCAGPVLLDRIRRQFAVSPDPPSITVQDASNETICRLIALGSTVFIEGVSAFGKHAHGLLLRAIEEDGVQASLSYVLHWHKDNDNPVFRQFRRVMARAMPAVTV